MPIKTSATVLLLYCGSVILVQGGLFQNKDEKIYKMTPGSTVVIRSPFESFAFYPGSANYKWKFLGSDGCIPVIKCQKFKLQSCSPVCTDYMELSDGGTGGQRYYSSSGPKRSTTRITILQVLFKSGFGLPRFLCGFKCTITCFKSIDKLTELETVPLSTPLELACECGKSGPSAQKIVGGSSAVEGYFRWQAGIVAKGQNSSVICGGTLICDRFVLTAAHCTNPIKDQPSLIQVLLNMYDNSNTNEIVIRRDVLKIYIHPHFDARTLDYDVSLLELNMPVVLTSTEEPIVNPVCFPNIFSTETFENRVATATGWGYISENGILPTILQEVQLPIIPNKECADLLKIDNFIITPRMICSGVKNGGKDTCQGDSGGFLAVQVNERWTQIGITSFGKGCGRPNKPGVYARILLEINDWIRTTAIAKGCYWCKTPQSK